MAKQRWQPRLTFSPPYQDDEGWKVRVCVDARRGNTVPQAEVEFMLNGENPFQQNISLPENGVLITEIPLPGQGVSFLYVNVHNMEDDLWWRSQLQQVRVLVSKASLPTLEIVLVGKTQGDKDGEWVVRYQVVDTRNRVLLAGAVLCLESPYDGFPVPSINNGTVSFTVHLPRGVTRHKFVVRHPESGTEFVDWIFRTT